MIVATDMVQRLRRHALRAWLLTALLIAASVAAAAPATPPTPPTQGDVKAAMLVNILRFMADRTASDPGQPLVITTRGAGPLVPALRESTRGVLVGGRPLLLLPPRNAADAFAAHVVVFTGERPRVDAAYLARLHARGVLTVGETAEFAATGGVLAFVVDQRRVRIHVNLDAARRAGIELPAQVLRLCTIHRDAP